MQRQIRILNTRGGRGAFALIAAVFLMLIISMLLLKMMSYSAQNAQEVTDDYLLEQAQLAAYGATEYAMLKISADDRTSACTDSFTLNYPSSGTKLFNVAVNVDYVWFNGTAPTLASCASSFNVTNPEQDGSAYIDVIVTSDPGLGLDEPIRFHRKTLQKL